MNAPLRQPALTAAAASLYGYCLFHLNLAFSSIEDDQRGVVIERCYWPLLRLAARHGAIGIEASAFTLEEIAARDPAWIAELTRLMAAGQVEFIGAGYAQLIGPLVPAVVNEANLRIGNAIYDALLGARPSLALINEQAYSAGLVPLYRGALYRAILMDWDNPGAQHPEWPAETRHLPQIAQGSDGSQIGLLWTNTVAFQKLQRLAHGDIGLDDYLAWLTGQTGKTPRALCLYASDAEIFDYRPGRYKTEEACSGEEWQRIEAALGAIDAQAGIVRVLPSAALTLAGRDARQCLALETPSCPVPVKKQRKYNLSRWAVTGRDDLAINAACERIARALEAGSVDDAAWKELCYLWSSDFRTHITPARWSAYCAHLRAAEERYCTPVRNAAPDLAAGEPINTRSVVIETPSLRAVLDRRRGLAIGSLHFAGHDRPCAGGLPHGHFDDIALQADWYTGDCVFEAPGEHKVTDLDWASASRLETPDAVIIRGQIETAKGPIRKTLTFHRHRACVDFDITFAWPQWGRGALRLGHITLLPDAYDWSSLDLLTHNGGRIAERFALAGQVVEHGAPVSFLVSSSYGLGMTEGWAELGDAKTRIRVRVARQTAPLLGLLTHRQSGGSLFCQLLLSALELDETRKPDAYGCAPRRIRFSLEQA